MSWPTNSAGIKTIVIILSFVFLFIVAVLLDLQYLYLMAVTLAVLPLASYGLAYFAATRFEVRRTHAETASEGRPVAVTLYIEARGGIPQGSLRVMDTLPEMLRPEGATALYSTPLDTWDGVSGERRYVLEPQRRGLYQIGPATIETTDPLGLFNFTFNVPVETEILILPQPIPMRNNSIGGEGRYGLRERDGKTHRGDGMDFHGVREYRVGDALRRVHWPTTARTGKLAVIEFERAYQQDVVVAIDRARGSDHGVGRQTTFEYAVKIAATLLDRTLNSGGGVVLLTQGHRIAVPPGAEDVDALRFQMLELLARLRADADTSLAEELYLSHPDEGAHFAVVTSQGDPRLSAYLTGRVQNGASVRLYFIEPSSFGGERAASPAVAGGELRIITQEDDPWQDGGRSLEHLLRE